MVSMVRCQCMLLCVYLPTYYLQHMMCNNQLVRVYHNVCCCFMLHFYILVFPSIKLPLLFTFLFLIHALYTSCYFMMHAFPMCPIAYHLTQHDVCIPRASTIVVRCSVAYLSCALWLISVCFSFN